MTIRSLPEPCWMLAVDDQADDGDWHSLGGDGSDLLVEWAGLWTDVPAAGTPVPLPELGAAPCVLLACSGCGVALGEGEGDHFPSEVEALLAAAEDGWAGEWCPACREHAWADFRDFLAGPGPTL
ncbi:hypothetical protein [Micromonospora sp. WMMD737]|uniref:hypothetical protein n=1 Tax=Micromonospora sp. WMMD737 TaxID=3404113 RepID=UPI003B935CCC